MGEKKTRTLILEEIQGILNQVSEETKEVYSSMVVRSEIVTNKLDTVQDKRET